MILHSLRKSNIANVVSLLVAFTAFAVASTFLHWVVMWAELTGLPSFLMYTLPFWVLISWATVRANETLLQSLLRNGLWGYAFILGIAGITLTIG